MTHAVGRLVGEHRLRQVVNEGQGSEAPEYHRRSLTGFCRAIRYQNEPVLVETYGAKYQSYPGTVVQKTAMGEVSGGVGGYIVPLDFSYELLFTIAEESIIYPRAQIVPMESREKQAPLVAITTPGSKGVPGLFAGMTFKWGSEQAPQETDPKFAQLDLTAWDLLGYSVVSNDWLHDTGDEGDKQLRQLIAKAASWTVDYAFFNGTGTAQQMPLGIIGAPGTKTITAGTPGTIAQADIVKVVAAMLPYGWLHGIWVANPSTLTQLMSLTGFIPNQGPGPPGCAGFLYSKPLFISEKLPPLGGGGSANKGCVVFIDPSLYVIGVRQEVLIDVSEHTLFQSNQSVIRVWLRVDGKPFVPQTVALTDTATNVSPFVALAA